MHKLLMILPILILLWFCLYAVRHDKSKEYYENDGK